MRLSSQVRVKNEGNCGEMLMKIYLYPETQDEVQFLHVSTTNFRLYRAFVCVRCEIVYLGNFSNEKTLFTSSFCVVYISTSYSVSVNRKMEIGKK